MIRSRSVARENESRNDIELKDFQLLSKIEVAAIVQKIGKPQNVALMIDGTRRLLKVEPEHNDDAWLYDQDHIAKLKPVVGFDIVICSAFNLSHSA